MDSLTLKSRNSFQISNNRKTTPNFSLRPLIFKLQQEVLKFLKALKVLQYLRELELPKN